MPVYRGLPDSGRIRLQEAKTFAFTGWSWARETTTVLELDAVSLRDDYPSVSSLNRLCDTDTLAKDNHTALFLAFDSHLSRACLRGSIRLEGIPPNETVARAIPPSHFFHVRGFSWLGDSEIDGTPSVASMECILSERSRETWREVTLDRDEFVLWFETARKEILAELVVGDSSSCVIATQQGARQDDAQASTMAVTRPMFTLHNALVEIYGGDPSGGWGKEKPAKRIAAVGAWRNKQKGRPTILPGCIATAIRRLDRDAYTRGKTVILKENKRQ